MAGVPVAKVEIEFTGGVWTDVTAWWDASQPVTITGGRADTDSRVGPGRLTGLTLVNDDGRFTVGNASGAYWPNVRAGKRVRLSMSTAASSDAFMDAFTDSFTTTDTPSWLPRFTGYVDGWPLTWGPNGATCTATLSATDALRLLDPVVRDGAWLEPAVDASVDAYWPFNDDWADLSHRPVIGAVTMVASGPCPRPTEAGPPGDPRPLPQGTAPGAWWYATVTTDLLHTWLVTCLFKASSPWDGWRFLYMENGAGNRVGAALSADGYLRLHVAGTADSGASTVNICDGAWWVVSVRVTDAGGVGVGAYVEAVRLDDGITSSAGVLELSSTETLLDAGARYLTVAPPPSSTMGHVLWWGPPPTPYWPVEVDIYAGFPEQSLWQWSTTWESIGTPVQIEYGPGDVGGTKLWHRPVTGTGSEMWRLVEECTGGLTHARRDGTLRYLHGGIRLHPFGAAALTISAEDIAPPLTLDADLVKIVNDVEITSKDVQGRTHAHLRSTDATSILIHGARALPPREVYGGPTDPVTGAVDLTTLVAGLLNVSETPRVPSLQIDLAGASTATQAAVLSGEWDGGPIDVWSLISVTGLPTVGGWVSSWQARVEGWTETLSIRDWSIRFNVSDATGVS